MTMQTLGELRRETIKTLRVTLLEIILCPELEICNMRQRTEQIAIALTPITHYMTEQPGQHSWEKLHLLNEGDPRKDVAVENLPNL